MKHLLELIEAAKAELGPAITMPGEAPAAELLAAACRDAMTNAEGDDWRAAAGELVDVMAMDESDLAAYRGELALYPTFGPALVYGFLYGFLSGQAQERAEAEAAALEPVAPSAALAALREVIDALQDCSIEVLSSDASSERLHNAELAARAILKAEAPAAK